jgi:predicted transcriptional regulator
MAKKRGVRASPNLGYLELEVLRFLWRAGEADVAEVHAAVGARRGISMNTVGSALERLHRKELVARRKVSHAHRYQAALSRNEFAVRQLAASLGELPALANRGLLVSFLDLMTEADPATLDELEALIARKRGETQS